MTITDSRRSAGHAFPNLEPPAGPDSRAAEPASEPEVSTLREASSHATIELPLSEEPASRGPSSQRAGLDASTVDTSPAGSDSRAAAPHVEPVALALREPNSHATNEASPPTARALRGPISRGAMADSFTDGVPLREPNSHATGVESTPEELASRGPISRLAEVRQAPVQVAPAGADSHAANVPAASVQPAPRGPNSRPADNGSAPGTPAPDGAQLAAHQLVRDDLSPVVGGDQQGRDRAANDDAPSGRLSLLDPALSLAADFLDDMERVKIANENRLRSLTRIGVDKDGVDRYVGLDADHPVVAQYAAMVEAVAKIEHDAVLTLQRMMRKHPLGAWVKAQRGIGEKQAARLLASIGDPYWRPEIVKEDGTVIPEGPRTVSALWAYSGLHVLPAAGRDDAVAHDVCAGGGDSSTGGDSSRNARDAHAASAGVAARRRKGEQANWSTKAKTRAYLIAESCLKQLVKPCHTPADGPTVHVEDCACSPYRLEYDRRKAHTTESRPDWTDGHRHADALRVASKAILRDLWRAARDWHLAQKESE